MAGVEVLEALAYIGSFWYFVFSAEYRRVRIDEFRKAQWWFGKPLLLVEALFSMVLGLAPLVLLALLVREMWA